MTKRSHGEGSIQARGNAWRIRYRVNGERFEKTVQGSRADAAKALREALKAGDDGKHVAPSKLTFGQWAETWLTLKARTLDPTTQERYGDLFRLHILPSLGTTPLQKVTATDIDRLYGEVAKTLAPGTVRFAHIVLKSCLKAATRKDLLATNPADKAETPKAGDSNGGVVLEEQALATLVAGFKASTLYLFVALAAFTGMRRGEILALRWIDVDLDKRTISVRQEVVETKKDGIIVQPPKTSRGIRTFTIDDALADLLRSKRKQLPEILPQAALVLPAVGTLTAFQRPRNVTNQFKYWAAKLGFPGLHPHDLRGTHETLWLDAGVPVHVVAARCGHDPAVLLRVYAKRTRKADTTAANVIGTLTKGLL